MCIEIVSPPRRNTLHPPPWLTPTVEISGERILPAVPQPRFSLLLPAMDVPNAEKEKDDEERKEDEIVVQ